MTTGETTDQPRNVTAPLQTYFTTADVDLIAKAQAEGRRVMVAVIEVWKPYEWTGPLDDDPEDAFGDSQGCGCCKGDTDISVLAARWLV